MVVLSSGMGMLPLILTLLNELCPPAATAYAEPNDGSCVAVLGPCVNDIFGDWEPSNGVLLIVGELSVLLLLLLPLLALLLLPNELIGLLVIVGVIIFDVLLLLLLFEDMFSGKDLAPGLLGDAGTCKGFDITLQLLVTLIF